MKRKFLVVLVAILSFLMVGSVFMTALSQVVGDDGQSWLFGSSYDFEQLAETKPTFKTTTPSQLYDFTTDAVQSVFGAANMVEFSVSKDGYTTFTAKEGDPHIYFADVPKCKPAEAKYLAITYRTTAAVKSEFFSTRNTTGPMGQDGTNFQWVLNNSGEWVTDVMLCDTWADAADTETFTAFRFDPLEQNTKTEVKVKVGDKIDIQYAAFFATEEDAKGFNLDEYKKQVAYEEEQARLEAEANKKTEWPDPEFKEMETVAEDTKAGTLKYTPSKDGKTVTISYELDGETKSYTVPNNGNYTSGGYAGVDDLDRPLYNSDKVGSYKADERYVGLFYFLWQGEHQDYGIYDLQKIIDELGVDGADNTDCGKYGPEGAMHYFAEPLYGYYFANDTWVMRKHAELLTNANIDFLYFDVTNGFPYLNSAKKLMTILHEFNEQGYDAPQVVFYTNSSAHSVVRQVYDNIYSKDYCPDTWFRIDGKPVIIGPEDANINGFFHMKQNQWPNAASKTNGWPWMDFSWPARVFPSNGDDGSAISVSIAQHSGSVCFSNSSLYNDSTNRGRSYTNSDNAVHEWGTNMSRDYKRTLSVSYNNWKKDSSLTDQGLNFQAQFDHAIASEATYILVTGWNEWVAQRQKGSNGSIVFIDTASMEFSRDAEMMRGGYFDNYYMQLIYNVQKLKGTAPIIIQDSHKPINVTGDFKQWDDVAVKYTDPAGDTVDRNGKGFGNTTYTNTSGRNDIVASKVTSDTKNIYFYVETKDDISMFDTKSSWMQLYVNVDANAETGWYGYDFIINNQAKDHFTTTVASYNGKDGAYSFATAGEVSYRVKGNQMMIAVPQELLGIQNADNIKLEFKWADSDTLYNEMEDFYCDGDVAPIGRLNYVYQNCLEVKVVETVVPDETDAETDSVTDAVATENVEDATLAETQSEDEGCASVLTTSAIAAVVTLCGAAIVCRKKKD